MLFLKLISVCLLCLDAYLGVRFLLNVLQILQTSKYSQSATLIYAIVFIGLAGAGFYFLFGKDNVKLSLWISIAPWFVILAFLLVNMIFGDYH
jgi:uncharacterized membrane protein